MKKRSHIPVDSYEKQNFKKKFLERKLQDEDAKQQIRQYADEGPTPSTPLPDTRNVVEKREL
jgi:hypothetical protein